MPAVGHQGKLEDRFGTHVATRLSAVAVVHCVKESCWQNISSLESHLRWHWVAAYSALLLLSLDVLLVGHLLLLLRGQAVLWRQTVVPRHRRLLCRDLGVTDVIRRVASFFVDAILTVGSRFGCIEACLRNISMRATLDREECT